MALDSNVEGLRRLESLSKIKTREVFCPINKVRAMTSPLMTMDDFSLKTSIVSVDLYDEELTKIVWRHTYFPELEEQVSFQDFMSNFSYIDRQPLIWGIYASSYSSLGKRDITCSHCESVMQDYEIFAEDLIQEDTFQLWEEESPFTEFRINHEELIHSDDIHKIEVSIKFPTIIYHINVLKLLSPEKLKDHFDKLGALSSKGEQAACIFDTIYVY